MMIVLTILSSMTIFGFVSPEVLPLYRYIMNPQMELNKFSLELESTRVKPAKESLIWPWDQKEGS